MPFAYKVKRECFFRGVLRRPGGKHDPSVFEEKLDDCPAHLELIGEENDASQEMPKAETAAKPAKKVTKKKVAKKAPAKRSSAPMPDDFQGKVPSNAINFES